MARASIASTSRSCQSLTESNVSADNRVVTLESVDNFSFNDIFRFMETTSKGIDSGGGLRLEIAARTDIGRRRDGNEDRALIALTSGEAHEAPWTGSAEVGESGAVLAVCDGMGGAAGGEIASSEAVDVLRARLARPLGSAGSAAST